MSNKFDRGAMAISIPLSIHLANQNSQQALPASAKCTFVVYAKSTPNNCIDFTLFQRAKPIA